MGEKRKEKKKALIWKKKKKQMSKKGLFKVAHRGIARCWKWGKEDGRQYYRGLIIQPSQMKKKGDAERRLIMESQAPRSWFHFLSLLPASEESALQKTHYLPFNQPPVTESKGFRDEAAVREGGGGRGGV